jgi:hypothetical protein
MWMMHSYDRSITAVSFATHSWTDHKVKLDDVLGMFVKAVLFFYVMLFSIEKMTLIY